MNIANEDIAEVRVSIPEGHSHIRTKVVLRDGTELVFQEASIANIVRAYVTIKTDPRKTSVRLRGMRVEDGKKGYAAWQLIESDDEGR